MNYVVICNPKVVMMKTTILDLPEEIQEILAKFADIVVDDFPNELPPKMNIRHHIDFILGASLPNKEAYRLTPQENEEIRNKVQGLLDKGLI